MSFDLKAKTWDDDYRSQRAAAVAQEIKRHIPRCKTAMEFGCGTGLVSFCLADIFDEITLIDSSQGMIDTLTEKIQNAAVNNMIPMYMDLTSETYEGKKFDAIYSSMVFHHIIDINNIIGKLYSMLNDGGCVCIVDLDKEHGSFHLNEPGYTGHNGFVQSEIHDIFMENGFKNIAIGTFYRNIKEIGDKQIPYSLFCLYAEK